MSAPQLWFVALGSVAFVVLVTLLGDLVLKLMGRQTISQWLRLHPRWYVWPLGAVLFGLAVLTVHQLYVIPWIWWYAWPR